MRIDIDKVKDLKKRWSDLDLKKASIKTKVENYSRWTLPYICPPDHSDNVELGNANNNSIGARGVNHLANKIVMTLFPSQQSFFRLEIDADTKTMLKQAMSQSGLDPEQGEEELAQAMNAVEEELVAVEKQANERMDMVMYRPQAVMAAKHLIITGNALIYHPGEGKPIQQMGIKNYSVVRDISGEVVEIMIKEEKAYETFRPEIQELLRNRHPDRAKRYKDEDNIEIFTQVVLEDDGKFHMHQAAEDVLLDTKDMFWPKSELPWIVLTWNLVHGEDYGRGLVEEYSPAFHALEVLNGSLLNIAGVMGDIKFFVAPNSLIDVVTVNASPSGSYHVGKPEEIGTAQLNKLNDAQFIATTVERYEMQLKEAFLLSSTRNAERVTAEEIRQDAQELEMSNGGIYSRLASTWQYPTALIILDQIGFDGVNDGVQPKILTGMDSLSRIAELDAYRMFLGDLALLENVPEDFRLYIKKDDYMAIVGQARGIDYKRIVKSEATVQKEQAAIAQQQQAMIREQEMSKGMAGAAKVAMENENG